MAVHLQQALGVPVSVINATGGKGVTGHNRGLRARPDGYTITMITLELNMMHWSGLTRLTWRDCVPLMSVNEDYAALFVRSDAAWRSLGQLQEQVRRQPGRLKASGTAAGGAWHLALAGWLIASGMKADDVTWISSTGAGPSLQELISGGLDMVCCSLPEARLLLESGQVRALGVMAPERAAGFEDVPTFREQGSDWTLGGWRGLAVPKGTPQPIVDVLVAAIGRVVTGQTNVVVGYEEQGGRRVPRVQTFPKFMAAERFNNRWRAPDDFRRFLAENDRKLGQLLTSPQMRSVRTDRFSPMAFPTVLLVLVGLTLLAMLAGHWRRRKMPASSRLPQQPPATVRGLANLAVMVAAVVLYIGLAEQIGFVLLAGVLLFGMLWWLGSRWWVALPVTVVFVPLVYQLFANGLRVPLPRGLLGW